MVAHNPSISYLAEYLSKAEIGDMKTGGIAAIEFNLTSWSQVDEGNGDLVRYTFPAEVSND
jgi:phosphohistidine phosphatase